MIFMSRLMSKLMSKLMLIDVDVDTGVTGSKKGHNIEVDGA